MVAINTLRLIDFRSYAALDVAFSAGAVALHGPNGAGKTNLLEAISLLTPGRGLRRAQISALARATDGKTQPAWGINATLADGENTRISIGQVPEHPRRRSLRIDGKTVTGADLAARVSLLWLTPAQDRLFSGPASDRRKFIDRFALALKPNHGQTSIRFEKARAERNRLLSDNVSDQSWYEALETDLADYGAKIAQSRVQMINALQTEISARNTAFPQSTIALDGLLENQFAQGGSLEEVTQSYKAALSEGRAIEKRAGRTQFGPHRTELHVTHAAKAMPASLCSTGEQKALLIGLVLAQARALGTDQPILLLDEVAAHLDEVRRAALARELLDLKLQVFMTGTDAALFSDFGDDAQHFHVKAAHLTPL